MKVAAGRPYTLLRWNDVRVQELIYILSNLVN